MAITIRKVESPDKPHVWDEDGCCSICGLDGAKYHWWRNSTYEGRAKQTPMPRCLQDDEDKTVL